jgi:hypothetical protein
LRNGRLAASDVQNHRIHATETRSPPR